MKATFSRPLENITGLKGSVLTLRCELNKPKGDVQWLKNAQEISPSRRHTIRAQGRERTFTIHQLAEEDAGEYTCESTEDRTSAVVSVEGKYNKGTLRTCVRKNYKNKVSNLGLGSLKYTRYTSLGGFIGPW